MELQLDIFHENTLEDILNAKIERLKEEISNTRKGLFRRYGDLEKIQSKEISLMENIMHRLESLEKAIEARWSEEKVKSHQIELLSGALLYVLWFAYIPI